MNKILLISCLTSFSTIFFLYLYYYAKKRFTSTLLSAIAWFLFILFLSCELYLQYTPDVSWIGFCRTYSLFFGFCLIIISPYTLLKVRVPRIWIILFSCSILTILILLFHQKWNLVHLLVLTFIGISSLLSSFTLLNKGCQEHMYFLKYYRLFYIIYGSLFLLFALLYPYSTIFPTFFYGTMAVFSLFLTVYLSIDFAVRMEHTYADHLHEQEILLREAKELDNIRSHFFANISHEIKTPLNVIFSTLQLCDMYMNRGDIDEACKQYKNFSKIIRQNCYRMLRITNNMIDVTKFNVDIFPMTFHNHNIISVIEDITTSIIPFAENEKIKIIFDTNEEEVMTAIDPHQMERVMLNLLSNAIKFTPKGGKIFVTMTYSEDELTVVVQDTGCGIPANQLNYIFDPFKQVESYLHKKYSGSGLGLYIVKSVIEKHNGKIHVESTVGAGTSFIFTLPVVTLEEDNEYMIHRELQNLEENRIEKISLEFSDVYRP